MKLTLWLIDVEHTHSIIVFTVLNKIYYKTIIRTTVHRYKQLVNIIEMFKTINKCWIFTIYFFYIHSMLFKYLVFIYIIIIIVVMSSLKVLPASLICMMIVKLSIVTVTCELGHLNFNSQLV